MRWYPSVVQPRLRKTFTSTAVLATSVELRDDAALYDRRRARNPGHSSAEYASWASDCPWQRVFRPIRYGHTGDSSRDQLAQSRPGAAVAVGTPSSPTALRLRHFVSHHRLASRTPPGRRSSRPTRTAVLARSCPLFRSTVVGQLQVQLHVRGCRSHGDTSDVTGKTFSGLKLTRPDVGSLPPLLAGGLTIRSQCRNAARFLCSLRRVTLSDQLP